MVLKSLKLRGRQAQTALDIEVKDHERGLDNHHNQLNDIQEV